MQRIGFLLNHDQVHQVAHSLPIALALAQQAPHLGIIVATTHPRLEAEVLRLAGGRLPAGLTLLRLEPRQGLGRKLLDAIEPVLPMRKLAIYGEHLEFFRSLGLLVVAEKTSLLLKSRYGLKDLRMVHTRHGAGDRAIGFNAASARFDHVLASGHKVADRLVRDAGVPPDAISVVGYPKFDIAPKERRPLPFQRNGRPTVLYNPHVSPHLSSWYAEGKAVLEYFRTSRDYNLIFAPHVMLFARPFAVTIDKLTIARPGRLDPRLYAAPHIHIDLSSPACTDMTYTNAADIYLGDVSSQVYEFLRRPRPCVFINAHDRGADDDPNYAHWRAGLVIERGQALGGALRDAQLTHGRYRPIQEAMFAQSFDLTDERSSDRAARAILQVLSARSAAQQMAA